MVLSYVTLSMGIPYSGCIISRYHEQTESQVRLYTVSRQSDIRNRENSTSTSPSEILSCDSNQSVATLCPWGVSISVTVQPFTSRKAFHILLAKLRPCSMSFSSYRRSLPAGELNNMPVRTESAPYCAIRWSA